MPAPSPHAPDPDPQSAAGKPTAADRATGNLLALGAVALLLGLFFTFITWVPATDFWWQAKAGEWIVTKHRIPHHDPFSWTAAGQPWVVQEWLTDVLFYVCLMKLGTWSLVAYKAGLGALACYLVLKRAWLRSESLPLALAVTLLAGYTVRSYADLRPQMLSFVLLAALFLVLDEYRAGRVKWLPWALPPAFALWGNLHGGVVVGLILLGLWVLGDAAGWKVLHWPSPGLARLALTLPLCALAVALNPNGFSIYWYPFTVLGHPKVMDTILEWFSPNFHQPYNHAFEVLLLAALGLPALQRPAGPSSRRDGMRAGEILVVLAMAHAALFAQRNMSPFGILAAPPAAAALASLWDEGKALTRLRAIFRLPPARLVGASLAAAGLLYWVPSTLPRQLLPGMAHEEIVAPDGWFEYTAGASAFPIQAEGLLERGEWPGRIYNDYEWGGYLIWTMAKTQPLRKVFGDGRAEVYYPTHAFDDQITIQHTYTGWSEALDRWGVQTILTNGTGALGRALPFNKNWKLAFTGPIEVIYVRKLNKPSRGVPATGEQHTP